MINTIIKADARLKSVPKVNIALFGPSGVGKTTQARTLDPATTLFVDLEAGTLAIQDWAGDVLDIRKLATQLNCHPWEATRAVTLLICGPDPADVDGPYSKAMFDKVSSVLGGAEQFAKYRTIYVDSITVASRMCFAWAQRQPQAFSDKTGKPDNRGAYGLLGQEMIRWLTHLQHSDRSTVVVGILDGEKNEFNQVVWSPQIEGSKTGRELPGIFDQVVTLQTFNTDDGKTYRAFVCRQDNSWGYPAKDRSGRLEMLEAPDLGALIRKVREGKRLDTTLVTSLPARVSEPNTSEETK